MKTNQSQTCSPLPPSDERAELCVLGCILMAEHVRAELFDKLCPSCFYVPQNQFLFKTMRDMYVAGKVIDEVSLVAYLDKDVDAAGGTDYIGRLILDTPGVAGYLQYADRVRKLAAERNIQTAALKLLNGQTDEGIKELDQAVKGSSLTEETSSLEDVKQELHMEATGQRMAIKWPWPMLNVTKALLPGSVTVLCGSPGASKSFFLLQAMIYWAGQGISTALLELEKGAKFHHRRALALIASNAQLLDDDWIRMNSAVAMDIATKHEPQMKLVGSIIQSPPSGRKIDCDYVLEWIDKQCRAKCRIIAIDPISAMQGRDQRFLDQERLIHRAQQLVTDHGSSLILVIHPRTPHPGVPLFPSLENVQGSRSFRQFTDTVLWLDSHPRCDESCNTPMGPRMASFNRTLWLLKVRLGPGAGDKIAFDMNYKTLLHTDCGRLPEK